MLSGRGAWGSAAKTFFNTCVALCFRGVPCGLAVSAAGEWVDSWDKAIERREELSAGGVEFVPFSIEAGGVWGPAARKFFRECIALADDDRDIDLYHWSSTRFSRAWFDSLSVLVARGRAKVSAAAAASDWPKRIRDMQYMDVDGSD